MATATVTWAASTGAISYMVQYKQTSSPTWITATSSVVLTTYDIPGLLPGTSYDFQVTPSCSSGNGAAGITTQVTPCIATVNIRQEFETASVIQNTTTVWPAANRTSTAFGTLGTLVYPINGYNSNNTLVTGYSATSITGTSFWNNPTGINSAGKLNATAIWPANTCTGSPTFFTNTNEWVGFEYDYYSLTAGAIIYVGIGGADLYQVLVNGVVVVSTPSASSSNYGYWNIYPITVNHGLNLIYMMGNNTISPTPAFGAEVYGNTQSDILTATSNSDLNILYSTSNEFCTNFKMGNTIGCNCSAETPGYYYSSGMNLCVKIL